MRMLERWGRAEDVAATRRPGRLSLSPRIDKRSINRYTYGPDQREGQKRGGGSDGGGDRRGDVG